MNHGDGDRTDDHREEQAGHGKRHGDGDRGADRSLGIGGATVKGEHHDDRGGHRGERGVGGDGGTNVGPTESHELQGATEQDALLKVTANEADQRTSDQRLVELELVEDALHTSEERDEND